MNGNFTNSSEILQPYTYQGPIFLTTLFRHGSNVLHNINIEMQIICLLNKLNCNMKTAQITTTHIFDIIVYIYEYNASYYPHVKTIKIQTKIDFNSIQNIIFILHFNSMKGVLNRSKNVFRSESKSPKIMYTYTCIRKKTNKTKKLYAYVLCTYVRM